MWRGLPALVRRRIGQGADRGGVVLSGGRNVPGAGGARGDRGASTIEFVFLTPVMFLMIFGAVQFAMYSFAEHVAKSAAQAGARTARAEADADPGGWAASAEEKARDYVRQLGAGLFTSPPEVTTFQSGSNVRVEVEGSVPVILPGMSMTVSAASEGPIERFVPDGG